MPIDELSKRRRLPRLGKIRLGIKEKTTVPCKCKGKNPDKKPMLTCRVCEGTGYVFRPKEVDYFVCPPEVQAIYGEKPKELPIMFPVENEEVFFQQWYMRYGYGVLKCIGDGINARTWDEEKNGFRTIPCPCEQLEDKRCMRQALLQFLLYEVPGAGVWQINTGSKNSIVDINSGIDYIRSLCERIRMIPLVLKREEMTASRTEKGRLKSSTHHTLKLDLANTSLKQLLEYAQVRPSRILLPSPDLEEDEQFYPPGGWTKEEEEATEVREAPSKKAESLVLEKEKKAFEETELKVLRRDLEILKEKFEEYGVALSAEEMRRIKNLKTVNDHKLVIADLNNKLEKEMPGDPGSAEGQLFKEK